MKYILLGLVAISFGYGVQSAVIVTKPVQTPPTNVIRVAGRYKSVSDMLQTAADIQYFQNAAGVQ